MELSDGVRLRTWTTGTASAAPPVVLVHGGPGLWDYLEPIARMIEDLTVVHRFDQRGCGGSDPSDEQTMRRLQDDLDELRQHWGSEQVVVIGHSFGATLALTYAAAYPERRPASAVQALAERITDHEMHLIEGVGHSLWRERPDALRQLLREFLTESA